MVHTIDVMDSNQVELGALVSALHRFAESPYLGGQCNRGHGRVRYQSWITNMETGEQHEFVKMGDALAQLGTPAEQAKKAYDAHLKDTYDAPLKRNESEIRGLLGAELCVMTAVSVGIEVDDYESTSASIGCFQRALRRWGLHVLLSPRRRPRSDLQPWAGQRV